MYIPDISRLFYGPVISISIPLDKSHVRLDSSVIAGLVGGGEAVSAMASVHVYENRRWLGWYNSPGSFQAARRYRLLAKSASFHRVFLDNNFTEEQASEIVHTDPTTLFELDGWKGPKFRAAHSGTIIEETGYLAALFMKECTSTTSQEPRVIPGRKTQPVGITIAHLANVPDPEMRLARTNLYTPFLAIVPILVSVGACTISAVYADWFAFTSILFGIVTSGLSCLVVGSGEFVFTHPRPANGSPPGDGILGSDTEIVLLKGPEGGVNSVTRGGFSLRFSSKTHFGLIKWCSTLLFIQFLVQLFLIPQGSLFGQVMFVASLGVSSVYNYSMDKERVHRDILFHDVLGTPKLSKYYLGTRTSAVVFMLLILRSEAANPEDVGERLSEHLNEFLPNDTAVWRAWKKTIIRELQSPNTSSSFKFGDTHWSVDGFSQQDKNLLKNLYQDAQAAHFGYNDYLNTTGSA